MSSRTVVALALLIASIVAPNRPAHAAYRQGRFLIGGIVTDTPVPADTTVLGRIAAAGVDWVFFYGWHYARLSGAAEVTAALEQLRAHRAGFAMKSLACYESDADRTRAGRGRLFLNRDEALSVGAIDSTLVPERGINAPSTLGWTIWDEPELGDSLAFRNIGLMSRRIAANPSSSSGLAFTNLFSSCIRDTAIADSAYTAYLERYLGLFDAPLAPPPLLSFDEYPFQVPERIENNWFRTLRLVRDATNAYARRTGARVPWQAMIQLSPYRDPAAPAFTAMFGVVNTRWQAYTALAYGAKGLCYYQLGPARSRIEVWGDGIIDERGDTVATTYSQVRALDADLHRLGPTLMRLDPVETFHADTLGWSGTKDELLRPRTTAAILASFNAGADSALAGHLKDRTNGDDYLMVVSKALVASSTFTLTLASRADSLFRISRSTGRQVLLGTTTNTIRLTRLAPGQGELFRIVE